MSRYAFALDTVLRDYPVGYFCAVAPVTCTQIQLCLQFGVSWLFDFDFVLGTEYSICSTVSTLI